jgi:hypothetical protein
MRLFEIAAVAFLSGVGATSNLTLEHDKLAAIGLANLKRSDLPNPEQCTLENAAVRREW